MTHWRVDVNVCHAFRISTPLCYFYLSEDRVENKKANWRSSTSKSLFLHVLFYLTTFISCRFVLINHVDAVYGLIYTVDWDYIITPVRDGFCIKPWITVFSKNRINWRHANWLIKAGSLKLFVRWHEMWADISIFQIEIRLTAVPSKLKKESSYIFTISPFLVWVPKAQK